MMTTKIEELWNTHKDTILLYCAKFPAATESALWFMGLKNTQEVTTENAGMFCQIMWEQLPDESYIYVGGFTQLCDIAEVYCFGEEDVNDVR